MTLKSWWSLKNAKNRDITFTIILMIIVCISFVIGMIAIAYFSTYEGKYVGNNNSKVSSYEGKYIGNNNSKVFHKESCSYLPDEENRVYFETWEDAKDAGYRPCNHCNP